MIMNNFFQVRLVDTQWVTLAIESQMLENHFILPLVILRFDGSLRLPRVKRTRCLAFSIFFLELLHFLVDERLHGASERLGFLLVIVFLKYGLSVTGEHGLLFRRELF